jgi:hypothetical protein
MGLMRFLGCCCRKVLFDPPRMGENNLIADDGNAPRPVPGGFVWGGAGFPLGGEQPR